jgi:hypothetical protein
LESDFPKNKHSQKEKHFPGNQTKFFFDWKVFSVDQKVFSVDQKVFSLTGKCFSLTGKCFSLTNFSNGKQTQKSLESEFEETNMTLVFIYYLFVPLRKIEKKNQKYATATDHC